jgi:hypothetical protein
MGLLYEMLLAADKLTDKDSVINKPFTYTDTQKVGGLIATITITVILVSILLLIAYRNFGPPARRASSEA